MVRDMTFHGTGKAEYVPNSAVQLHSTRQDRLTDRRPPSDSSIHPSAFALHFRPLALPCQLSHSPGAPTSLTPRTKAASPESPTPAPSLVFPSPSLQPPPPHPSLLYQEHRPTSHLPLPLATPTLQLPLHTPPKKTKGGSQQPRPSTPTGSLTTQHHHHLLHPHPQQSPAGAGDPVVTTQSQPPLVDPAAPSFVAPASYLRPGGAGAWRDPGLRSGADARAGMGAAAR